MDIGQIDYKIPGSLNLGGMIAQQQDVATGDIQNQARQQQMAQSAAAFPFQQQRAGLENTGMQQEQQMKQVAMQRQVQARQIYQGSLDDKGQLDPDKYISGLNQSGLSDVAQQFQKDVADRQEKISHANYLDQFAKVRNQTATLAQLNLQANNILHGAALLYNHYPELAKTDSLTPEAITPVHVAAYKMFYDNISKDGFQNQLDSPEQFQANPAVAMTKIQQLSNEAPDKLKEAKEASEATLRAAQAELARHRAAAPYTQPKVGGPGTPQGGLSPLEKQGLAEFEKVVEGRSGASAQQVTKMNSAIHARQAILSARDPDTGEIDPDKLPSMMTEELATSIASMLSAGSGGVTSEAQRKGLQQATLSGDVNKMRSYFSGQPFAATTKSFIQFMTDQIDRQGAVADHLINKSIDNIKQKYVGLGMNPDRAASLFTAPNQSYKEFSQENGIPYFTPSIPKNQRGAAPARALADVHAEIIQAAKAGNAKAQQYLKTKGIKY
jgi:hypothetical protein